MNSIQNYLLDKSQELTEDNFEENPWEAYPLNVVDNEGNYREGFLQDATHDVAIAGEQEVHSLDVIWLEKASNKVFILRKECTAPVACRIRWDDVHCAFSFQKQSFEDEEIILVDDED